MIDFIIKINSITKIILRIEVIILSSVIITCYTVGVSDDPAIKYSVITVLYYLIFSQVLGVISNLFSIFSNNDKSK